MIRPPALLVVVGLLFALTACMARGPNMDDIARSRAASGDAAAADEQLEVAREQLDEAMLDNPDLPAWHEQRGTMALALGDRQFEQGFDRVFDSMTVALATLGCRVQNMERTSGYITASIPELPPAQLQSLLKDARRQYAAAKGFPAAVVDDPAPDNPSFDASAMMNRMLAGLTLSMVRQGTAVTKVKLRFDNVYYPGLVAEYYAVVWRAVDKQMFLDKGLD